MRVLRTYIYVCVYDAMRVHVYVCHGVSVLVNRSSGPDPRDSSFHFVEETFP